MSLHHWRSARSATSRASTPKPDLEIQEFHRGLGSVRIPDCAHITLESNGEEGQTVGDMVDLLAHFFEKPKAVLRCSVGNHYMSVMSGSYSKSLDKGTG